VWCFHNVGCLVGRPTSDQAAGLIVNHKPGKLMCIAQSLPKPVNNQSHAATSPRIGQDNSLRIAPIRMPRLLHHQHINRLRLRLIVIKILKSRVNSL
jgi:hypothetical protein